MKTFPEGPPRIWCALLLLGTIGKQGEGVIGQDFSEDARINLMGRGSSVVEQSIRNRQVVGSTPTLGSITSSPVLDLFC